MRTLTFFVLFLLSAVTLSACSSGDPVSQLKLCKDTVKNYPEYRDNPDKAIEYSELFAADGTFILGDAITKGREALASRHQQSHSAAVWRHEVTDPIFRIEDGKIFAESSVVVETGPSFENLDTKIEATYSDEFIILGDDCKIKTRHAKVTTNTQ